MLPILLVLGLGLAVFSITSDDDDDDGVQATAVEVVGGSDDTDGVIDEAQRGAVESALEALITEGELTEADADTILERTTFFTGPGDISTGAGDDGILGSAEDDTIDAGADDDQVYGGAGNDDITLAEGNDSSGFDLRAALRPDDIEPFMAGDPLGISEAELEGGDDTIRGGSGNDQIADGFGSNRITGSIGNDFIITVDQDELSPDVVQGGYGQDVLIVDEGDQVQTGPDAAIDRVTVDLFAGIGADYDPVVIREFEVGRDIIELEGRLGQLRATGPGPDPVTFAESDGNTTVSVSGVPVVTLEGATGLVRADILVST